jgi:hypothetical protein
MVSAHSLVPSQRPIPAFTLYDGIYTVKKTGTRLVDTKRILSVPREIRSQTHTTIKSEQFWQRFSHQFNEQRKTTLCTPASDGSKVRYLKSAQHGGKCDEFRRTLTTPSSAGY